MPPQQTEHTVLTISPDLASELLCQTDASAIVWQLCWMLALAVSKGRQRQSLLCMLLKGLQIKGNCICTHDCMHCPAAEHNASHKTRFMAGWHQQQYAYTSMSTVSTASCCCSSLLNQCIRQCQLQRVSYIRGCDHKGSNKYLFSCLQSLSCLLLLLL